MKTALPGHPTPLIKSELQIEDSCLISMQIKEQVKVNNGLLFLMTPTANLFVHLRVWL